MEPEAVERPLRPCVIDVRLAEDEAGEMMGPQAAEMCCSDDGGESC